MEHMKMLLVLIVGLLLGAVAHHFYCKHQDMNQVEVQSSRHNYHGGNAGMLGNGGAGGVGTDY